MRRVSVIVAIALIGALAAAGAGAGAGSGTPVADRSPIGTDQPAAEASGPARLDHLVTEAIARAAPDGLLDLVVSLDRPANPEMQALLAGLGLWSRSFAHIPAAGIRLPVARIGDLVALDGVRGVYTNEALEYFLKDSAALMNTSRAWNELGVTGKGVTVAILDSGVDFTHPDLAPAMKANVKLPGFGKPGPVVPIEGLPNTDNTIGHGTHVAGDVAGRGTASGGTFRGLAYEASLVGIGAGDGLFLYTVLEGFDWIMANKDRYEIRVVNNSWGSSFEPFDPYHPLNLATKRVADAGIVVVFANGNDSDEMSMNPWAVPPWVLPVGAGKKDGGVTDFSSGGIEADTVGLGFVKVDLAGETRRPLHMGLYHPAVLATGDKVVAARSITTYTPLTALPDDINLPPQQVPYYTTLSGTSMAAPEAAGVVALILQAAPELSPTQVRMVLQSTARPIPEVPFYRQGYGYTDASGAVDLARALHGKAPAEIQAELDKLQAARDVVVLSGLAHPTHTYAWTEVAPTGAGSLTHKISVPEGTTRIKIVTNGGSLPFVGVSTYDVTVTDASGREVGTVSNSAESGTTMLDLDLANVEPPAFGEWTVEVFASGSLVLPASIMLVDDNLPKRAITTLVSLFGAGSACSSLEEFAPRATVGYRLQDDVAEGFPYPTKPDHTYVGAVPNGALGQRSSERRLAGTFGQLSTATSAPVFTTPPLSEPLTLGGPAKLEVFVQGPSETVSGFITGQLLDFPPEGEPTVIGESPPGAVLAAGTLEPQKTETPIVLPAARTIPAGHWLGLTMMVSWVGTSGHTLFYDSNAYPSGLSITTGENVVQEICPETSPDETVVTLDPQPVPGEAPTGSNPASSPGSLPVLPVEAPPIPAPPAEPLAPTPALPLPPAEPPLLQVGPIQISGIRLN